MRLGDYKYPTDYRAHKQWGHNTLWTILNVTLISSLCLDTVIWNRPWRIFGNERSSHWVHTEFLFHASVAYISLCSVAYIRERSDSTRPVYADIIMTSIAFCWRPLHSGFCGFHYGAMVSIRPNFSRVVDTETGFNPGWTLIYTFECFFFVRASNLRQTQRLSHYQEWTHAHAYIMIKHPAEFPKNLHTIALLKKVQYLYLQT